MKPQQKNLYTIPAGARFAESFAAELLQETEGKPEALSQIRILLPTRRAGRVLREAFLALSPDKPLLLPRMQPLGDIEDEEFNLTGFEGFDAAELPPAITPLRRQVLLARLVGKAGMLGRSPAHALALATALGRLIDQVHTESLNLSDLHKIVPAEFAAHWQITLDFLNIIAQEWPKILAAEGRVDGAFRRNILIQGLSKYWRSNPPPFPVIAAGSTGSIPATEELLSTIAGLARGRVILPGLDQSMDTQSWEELSETHPQYGFKKLLQHMGMDRDRVKPWPSPSENPVSAARRALATELMRPAATSETWTTLATSREKLQQFAAALQDLNWFECANEREEGQIIALMLRETLEHPGRTAALVTPDRALARRVMAACERWGIKLDDSGGQPLSRTAIGSWLRLTAEACARNLAPVPLLALLKHRFNGHKAGLAQLEKLSLRGPRPAPGLQGIYDRLEQGKDAEPALELLRAIEPALKPLLALSSGTHKFQDLLQAHITLARTLARDTADVWSGESGEASLLLLANLETQADGFEPMTLQSYIEVLTSLMQDVTVRPAWGTHPRLSILGQLEARLVDADLVILAGLNEGTWPPEAGPDPWMSRPMRKEFGLPSAERGVGLAAHDFVQGFCAPQVTLTRSIRAAGAPTRPARWLQRLETVLTAAGIDKARLSVSEFPAWAKALDAPADIRPVRRPEPRPPANKRPKELPATAIETWQKDPYGIYARYILGLRKLKPLEQEPDAAARGDLLHKVLKNFVTAAPDKIPSNASSMLQQFATEELARRHDDPAAWSFWWPRFAKLADWYLDHEADWRQSAKPLKTEVKGKADLGGFTLTATPDRIDKTGDTAAIIDYKSNSNSSFTPKAITSGASPQLTCAALILTKGGFQDLPAMPVSSVEYWILTGGSKPGEIKSMKKDIEGVVQRTEAGIKALAAAFADPNTPYYSLPDTENAPRFNDYEHLARVKEWTALGETDTGEAA